MTKQMVQVPDEEHADEENVCVEFQGLFPVYPEFFSDQGTLLVGRRTVRR
jgi:hypothetical protein